MFLITNLVRPCGLFSFLGIKLNLNLLIDFIWLWWIGVKWVMSKMSRKNTNSTHWHCFHEFQPHMGSLQSVGAPLKPPPGLLKCSINIPLTQACQVPHLLRIPWTMPCPGITWEVSETPFKRMLPIGHDSGPLPTSSVAKW